MDFLTFKDFISIPVLIAFYYLGATFMILKLRCICNMCINLDLWDYILQGPGSYVELRATFLFSGLY